MVPGGSRTWFPQLDDYVSRLVPFRGSRLSAVRGSGNQLPAGNRTFIPLESGRGGTA